MAKWAKAARLLQRLHPGADPGLVTGSGIFVKNALLDGFIEGRDRSRENLLGGSFVVSGESLAHFAKSRPQPRGIAAIPLGTSFGFTGALQRRKMICHYFD